MLIDPSYYRTERPTRRASSRTAKGGDTASAANQVLIPKGAVARARSRSANRTVSPFEGLRCEPLDSSKDTAEEYGHPRGHGTDLHALHAAESRQRSGRLTGTLRGGEYKKDRYQQVV